jgi:dolichyl-phosphate-mannose-protein mannosyltransferase
LLLIGALAARVVWLDLPRNSLIFDEAYYVNAARILLGWPVEAGAHYAGATAGLDPNMEHPPLGKLILALSMLIFGDNGIGWRIPSVIAGMTALGAVYMIVRAAGETTWLAILAVGLLAFDNLTLVHGRIGTLDMLVLAPILVGAWLALRDRWVLAGVFMALGMLVKLTAIYGLLAVLILLLIRISASWRRDRRISIGDLRPAVTIGIVSAGLFLAGLWALDARYTTYATPIDHVRHMIEYGANLKSPVDHAGICTTTDSAPWEWPFNECQITYLRVDVTVRSGDTVISKLPTIDFRGALNPLLAGAIPLAFLLTSWFAWRRKNRLARWSVAWAAANYLPYVALAIVNHRITYIYYFLPVIPAIATAVAILLLRSGLPRFVLWGFLVAYLVGFAAYFPFRQIP